MGYGMMGADASTTMPEPKPDIVPVPELNPRPFTFSFLEKLNSAKETYVSSAELEVGANGTQRTKFEFQQKKGLSDNLKGSMGMVERFLTLTLGFGLGILFDQAYHFLCYLFHWS